MNVSRLKSSIIVSAMSLSLAGCGMTGTTGEAPPIKTDAPQFIPYIPATRPVESESDIDLPTAPRDAAAAPNLLYSIEIWEILFPRNTVSSDEEFWKRVDESAIDLSRHDVLFKNGIRVGELPISDYGLLQNLVSDKKGRQTKLSGLAGKQIDLIITPEIENQTIFFFDRENKLVGRTYDKSANLIYFSFETTPRKPDFIRLALTPAVKALTTRIQYTTTPGKSDREISYVNDEFHYDASMTIDLPITSILVMSPSIEARDECSLGYTYFVKNTPSEQLDRMLFIVPRAFKRESR